MIKEHMHLSTNQAKNKKQEENPLQCHFIPFNSGRRPTDEINHPGLGSSDNAGLILPKEKKNENFTYLLYKIEGLDKASLNILQNCHLTLTLSCDSGDGRRSQSQILKNWNQQVIQPMIFDSQLPGKVNLKSISLREGQDKCFVIRLAPNIDFIQDSAWSWRKMRRLFKIKQSDESDLYSFENMFNQLILVELNLVYNKKIISTTHTTISTRDTQKSGSLYRRILEKVIKVDTLKQARQNKIDIGMDYHPWFPVLSIGILKNILYTNTLIDDITYKTHQLTDPRWLMRVGLFLEFLTCIGIFEAVKDDLGDLLTPAERRSFTSSPLYKDIREYINVKEWKQVWNLRFINFPAFGIPNTGPVSAMNLLQKEKATLAFLEVHHMDLKHAIELAGFNPNNAQETWNRVFRDAERAVLMTTESTFPELEFLPSSIKEYILWNKDENVDMWIKIMLDQDKGLYEIACDKYRDSMNEVASWAKSEHYIDYTGEPCISEKVSLFKAYLGKKYELFKKLQLHDGYAPELDIVIKPLEEMRYSPEQIYNKLNEIPLFNVLKENEYRQFAQTARTITLAPMERITIQGRHGSSLFIVGEGRLEVVFRHQDGYDQIIGEIGPGEVFGEISVITKAPRSTTIRALDRSVVIEISQQQYEAVIKNNRGLIKNLALLMQQRIKEIKKLQKSYQKESQENFFSRLWRRLFK